MLALGEGGKATDREGALRTIAADGLGRFVVIVLAIGFGSYALWRLAQAVLGHDVEEPGAKAKWSKRVNAARQGGDLRRRSARLPSRSFWGSTAAARTRSRQPEGILGWPAGRWIVFGIAVGIAGAALWNLYRASPVSTRTSSRSKR